MFDNDQLPTIDAADLCQPERLFDVGARIYDYLSRYGFFYLSGTVFTDVYVERIFQSGMTFLDQPEAVKLGYKTLFRLGENRVASYLPKNSEQLDPNNKLEEKEVFELWIESGYNQDYITRLMNYDDSVDETIGFDIQFPDMHQVFSESFDHCIDYVGMVLRALALSLGETQSYFADQMGGNNMLRITRCWKDANFQPDPDNTIRVGEHVDQGYLTCGIYQCGDGEGLQVRDPENGWIDLLKRPDMISIHCGNMLELRTNGRIKGAEHRVVDKDWTGSRFAINVFTGPNQDVTISPMTRFANLPAADAIGELAEDIYRRTTDAILSHIIETAD